MTRAFRRAVQVGMVLAAFGALGCSHVLTITTDPVGAKIYVNGEMVGVSPTKYKAKGSKEFTVRAEKPGYQAVEKKESWSKDKGEELKIALERD